MQFLYTKGKIPNVEKELTPNEIIPIVEITMIPIGKWEVSVRCKHRHNFAQDVIFLHVMHLTFIKLSHIITPSLLRQSMHGKEF